MPGLPFSSSRETRASPTPSSVMVDSTFSLGLLLKVSAAALTALWSLGVKARKACWTRLPICPSTISGTSNGFWLIKYTPTPLERISRTTCSIFSYKACGASLNRRWASSKKNTSLGFSGSPTSGSCSKSSDRSHKRKVA